MMVKLMTRLDLFITEKGYYQNRTRASRAIMEGCVKVDGNVVTKTSYGVDNTSEISCSEDPVPYVSRGGLKLERALNVFNIIVDGKEVLDIGASTGGFTEVLLSKGAKSVTAVDVGHGQLAEILKNDKRVVNMEGTDIRNLTEEIYKDKYDFVCADVSFISLKLIIPSIMTFMKPGASCVCLIKPQFEVGRRSALSKKGVVKDPKTHKKIIEGLSEELSKKLVVKKVIPSPVKGGDGNTEYLVWAEKPLV